MAASSAVRTNSNSTAESAANQPADRGKPLTGRELFVQHCAACHGDLGDGKGIAARFLYPKPRDFQLGRFRLVSTVNGVPTRDDLLSVLKRGMPGSSMPSWAHLSDQELNLLVDEIFRIRQTGLHDQIVAQLKDDGDEIDEADVGNQVQQRTTPGEIVEAPPIAAPDDAVLVRGKQLFLTKGCAQCHGEQGRGDGQQVMVDSEGLPTRPRDLTLGIFKGNHDPSTVFRRIRIGMPGTPMPASPSLSAQDISDVTQFVLSLSSETARNAVVLNRARIIAHYAKVADAGLDDESWQSCEEVAVRLAPLWWRGDVDPNLRVQAMHDGRTLAVRLRWRDATPNWNVARTESFKDAAALELYRGPREPFIGMGGPQAPIDVWFWDADRQRMTSPPPSETQVASRSNSDGAYPNMVVDMYPLSEPSGPKTAEYHRPGTDLANQPAVSLPAVAAGNQIAPQEFSADSKDQRKANRGGGSSLAAVGPGSATFRPPLSQAVGALGQWKDGQWCVVFRRALNVPEAEGVSLSPGERASAGFAIWDGARGDRNGQKMVSIWQDVELETKPQ